MMGYRNDTLRTLFEKHSIRKYLDKPIVEEALNIIVDAGLRAPSSGGTQPTTFLVTTQKETNLALGRLSCELYDEGPYPVSSAQPSIADDPSLRDGFYGAPVAPLLHAARLFVCAVRRVDGGGQHDDGGMVPGRGELLHQPCKAPVRGGVGTRFRAGKRHSR